MSPKFRINAKFLSLLHERGLTVERLAEFAKSGRAHVTQVLANVPGRGNLTRPKLVPHLTADELALLGWNARGEVLHMERSNRDNGRIYIDPSLKTNGRKAANPGSSRGLSNGDPSPSEPGGRAEVGGGE